MQRESAERFASATDLVQAIDALLAPLPGRGGYRFTLADGSPQSVRGSNPSHPALEAPLNFAFGQSPLMSPLPRSAPEMGQASPGIGVLLRDKLSELARAFDRARRLLPRPVRDAIRHVLTQVLLLVSAALSLLLTLLGISLCLTLVHAVHGKVASARPSARLGERASALPSASVTAAPIATASDAEVQDAAKSGVPALDALSQKYPKDPHPVLELARASVAARRTT